jgi:hypothetical protein
MNSFIKRKVEEGTLLILACLVLVIISYEKHISKRNSWK